jgi:hypothetical protein
MVVLRILAISVAVVTFLWAQLVALEVRRFYRSQRAKNPKLRPSLFSNIWSSELARPQLEQARRLRARALLMMVILPVVWTITVFLILLS